MLKEPAAGYGVVPLDQARTMDGLALMTGVMNGTFPAPPIARVLGFRVSEVEAGRVVFTYAPVFDHYNPLGSVHGGVAATLLDSVMGCCIHTTLKAGTGYTTVEIKVNYVRAMTDRPVPSVPKARSSTSVPASPRRRAGWSTARASCWRTAPPPAWYSRSESCGAALRHKNRRDTLIQPASLRV